GYAVGCALKACIATQTTPYDFPPPKKEMEECYTHDLEKLMRRAALEGLRQAEAAVSEDFRKNWLTVKEWNESSRYERSTKDDAESLYNAISDPTHGVLQWLKRYW